MVDVARMPEKSFGYVPTPALVAPIEFTLRADDYAALGGYASRAVTLEDVLARHKGPDRMSAVAARLDDGRLHLQHGPIDLIVEAFGAAAEVERAYGQAMERFGDILPTLVGELQVLRRPVGEAYPLLQGPVARRMAEAVGRIAPSSSRRWPPLPAPSPTRCCRRWCVAARSPRPM